MNFGRCILLAASAVLGLSISGRAHAQTQAYTTPLYSPSASPGLDPHYGLPSFGMPGADVPQQKTAAPAERVPPKPDFYANMTGDKGPIDELLPGARPAPKSWISGTETPLYTTSTGMETGDTTRSGTMETDEPPTN